MGSDRESNTTANSDGKDGVLPEAPQNLFQLSQVVHLAMRARCIGEPLVDYSKSIIMTLEDYISAMEAKATKNEVVAKEHED